MLEIITGYADNLNAAIDLMIDNWDYWDSSDKSSDIHSATKGNCKITYNGNNQLLLYRGNTPNAIASSAAANYTLIKNNKAVLLIWGSSCLMATTASDLNGSEKFILGLFSNSQSNNSTLVNDEETYTGRLPTSEVSQTFYQLAELIMPFGGAVADGVKRVLFSYSQNQQQTVSINGENYYIFGRWAMMDV